MCKVRLSERKKVDNQKRLTMLGIGFKSSRQSSKISAMNETAGLAGNNRRRCKPQASLDDWIPFVQLKVHNPGALPALCCAQGAHE